MSPSFLCFCPVVVSDTTPPTISNCPQPATFTTQFGTPQTVASWVEPTAVDDCGGQTTFTQSHRPGDQFPVGVTQVTYIFSDSSNNQATCSFTITGK